jgi:hypothetical protein
LLESTALGFYLKLLFLLLFFFFYNAYANNPNVYPSLGNKLYDSLPYITKLVNYPEFYPLSQTIAQYIQEVEETKKLGFAIASNKSNAKKEYLEKLRALATQYDFFRHMAKELFYQAIKKEDFDLFVRIVDSGLIDTTRHKEEILTFYHAHEAQIIPFGKLADIVAKDAIELNSLVISRKEAQKQKEEQLRKFKEQDQLEQLKLQKQLEKQLFDGIEK